LELKAQYPGEPEQGGQRRLVIVGFEPRDRQLVQAKQARSAAASGQKAGERGGISAIGGSRCHRLDAGRGAGDVAEDWYGNVNSFWL
jgi:hypothetical protein